MLSGAQRPSSQRKLDKKTKHNNNNKKKTKTNQNKKNEEAERETLKSLQRAGEGARQHPMLLSSEEIDHPIPAQATWAETTQQL